MFLGTPAQDDTAVIDRHMEIGRRDVDMPRPQRLAVDCVADREEAPASEDARENAGMGIHMKDNQDRRGQAFGEPGADGPQCLHSSGRCTYDD
jgi:hypothetical protein